MTKTKWIVILTLVVAVLAAVAIVVVVALSKPSTGTAPHSDPRPAKLARNLSFATGRSFTAQDVKDSGLVDSAKSTCNDLEALDSDEERNAYMGSWLTTYESNGTSPTEAAEVLAAVVNAYCPDILPNTKD